VFFLRTLTFVYNYSLARTLSKKIAWVCFWLFGVLLFGVLLFGVLLFGVLLFGVLLFGVLLLFGAKHICRDPHPAAPGPAGQRGGG